MSLIGKIVSGGQTGADRAALDAAIDHGIPHGGWCTRNRQAEDGRIDDRYALTEAEGGYAKRTRMNVIDSDGTLVFNMGELSDGTLGTINHAQKQRKPYLIIQLDAERSDESCVWDILVWLQENKIATLNVAGPRESKRPGIHDSTYRVLEEVIHGIK